MVAMELQCYQSDATFASEFLGFWTSRISMMIQQGNRMIYVSIYIPLNVMNSFYKLGTWAVS
jgi:hypothetical protein